MDFAISTDHRVKMKKNEKVDKYLDFALELKKQQLWNMRMNVVPIVIGALGIVSKGLKKNERSEKSEKVLRLSRPENS